MSAQRTALPSPLEGIAGRARPLALGGGVLWAIGALLNPDQGLRSYLFAFLFWIGLAIGCQSILMLHHLSGGHWGLGIRRMLEAGSRTLRYAWVAFLPVAAGLMMGKLFPWVHPVEGDELLKKKLAYLNVPFFLGRAVFYFACWALLAHLLSKWSLERDRTPDPSLNDKLQGLSGGGLVLMGLTITFASVDWAMSLNPHWFSTIYGVLFMVGQVLSALAFMILLVAVAGREKPFDSVITRDVIHDLGKLLFAFVMLWAYMQLSQFLIIWSANLPEEVPWYIQRLSGGWQFLALALVGFHFVLPFLLLLSRSLKRNAAMLARVAAGIFLVRLLDLYWLIAPDFQGHGAGASHGLHVHWLDVVAPVFLGGLWLLMFTTELRSRPLLTPGDPELQEILAEGRA
jgi:hypothetical protein